MGRNDDKETTTRKHFTHLTLITLRGSAFACASWWTAASVQKSDWPTAYSLAHCSERRTHTQDPVDHIDPLRFEIASARKQAESRLSRNAALQIRGSARFQYFVDRFPGRAGAGAADEGSKAGQARCSKEKLCAPETIAK